jgi:hypothetical protein
MYSTLDSHKGRGEGMGTMDSTAFRDKETRREQRWIDNSSMGDETRGGEASGKERVEENMCPYHSCHEKPLEAPEDSVV